MQSLNVRDAIDRVRTLWTELLYAKSFPTDEQIISLIAGLQFPAIRDQLMTDIPGTDEPMDRVRLAQTNSKPLVTDRMGTAAPIGGPLHDRAAVL